MNISEILKSFVKAFHANEIKQMREFKNSFKALDKPTIEQILCNEISGYYGITYDNIWRLYLVYGSFDKIIALCERWIKMKNPVEFDCIVANLKYIHGK